MGWDAYATYEGEMLDVLFEGPDMGAIENPEFRAVFATANEEMMKICGIGDAYLRDGSLGGGCLRMMECATGQVCFDAFSKSFKIDWNPETVQQIFRDSNWDFPFYKEDLDELYYWSTFIFLKTCADNNFGIQFNW